MVKKFTVLFILLLMVGSLKSQTIAGDTISIGGFNARINCIGNHFYDFAGNRYFEIPKGSSLQTLFNSALWVGGIDNMSMLHFAGERYRQSAGGQPNKGDFFPGPLTVNGSASVDSLTMIQYNRLWKINRSEIDYHIAHWADAGYVPPVDIATWPAHGDTLLHQAYMLAPFADIDNNGIYNPLMGDYPLIRGDECVYFVFNDAGGLHNESGGLKLGLEIRGMAYAFDCPSDSALHYTLFMHYDIINRSTTTYNNVYLGVFTDIDLGLGWNDYVGSDSALNSFYIYNADSTDGNGLPSDNGYGQHPPAQSTTFLNKTMNRFMYFSNLGTTYWAMTDPASSGEYYSYMNAYWKDNTHLLYGGQGHQNFGGTFPTNYMYSGNVHDSLQWSEISAHNTANDRRGLGSMGPYVFSPSYTFTLDFAYVFARDYNGDNLASVDLLKQYITQIKTYFQNDSTPCGGSFSVIQQQENAPAAAADVNIYPNPADNYLYVVMNTAEDKIYTIYNICGAPIIQGKLNKSNAGKIDITNLTSGIYLIKLSDKNRQMVRKFVKR